MAIARVFDGKGWSSEQYDALIDKLVARMGLAPGRSVPGVLFHWAAATKDGMRAVDVYESRQAGSWGCPCRRSASSRSTPSSHREEADRAAINPAPGPRGRLGR